MKEAALSPSFTFSINELNSKKFESYHQNLTTSWKAGIKFLHWTIF